MLLAVVCDPSSLSAIEKASDAMTSKRATGREHAKFLIEHNKRLGNRVHDRLREDLGVFDSTG